MLQSCSCSNWLSSQSYQEQDVYILQVNAGILKVNPCILTTNAGILDVNADILDVNVGILHVMVDIPHVDWHNFRLKEGNAVDSLDRSGSGDDFIVIEGYLL